MFGQPVLAPWQLHALQRDPRLRRKRLAKQAALVDAEDYVDAVYMVLAAAARAQANTARDALVWNPPHRTGRRRLRGSWRPLQAWATPRALSSARLVRLRGTCRRSPHPCQRSALQRDPRLRRQDV